MEVTHDNDLINKYNRKNKSTRPFYYLVRNISPNTNSPYPTTQQLVYCAETREEVERHLEQVKNKVALPKGCHHSIDFF